MKAIRWLITVIALTVGALVWAVVGFIFWIPLLLRSILIFTAAITASVWESKVPIDRFGRRLQFAIGFYLLGFQRIGATYRNAVNGVVDQPPTDEVSFLGLFWILFRECLWTAVTILIVVGIIDFLFLNSTVLITPCVVFFKTWQQPRI